MLKEIEIYLTVLSDLRNQIKTLLEQFPDQALDWRPIEGEGEMATNSAAVMALHLAGSENFFMREVISGQPVHRDRGAEFIAKGVAKAELKRRLEAGDALARSVLSPLTSAQLEESRKWGDRTETVRRVILIVIAHFANHLGHMQLTHQLWLTRSRK
jgi:hypothetical protein